jgi:hypothetical protein
MECGVISCISTTLPFMTTTLFFVPASIPVMGPGRHNGQHKGDRGE